MGASKDNVKQPQEKVYEIEVKEDTKKKKTYTGKVPIDAKEKKHQRFQ